MAKGKKKNLTFAKGNLRKQLDLKIVWRAPGQGEGGIWENKSDYGGGTGGEDSKRDDGWQPNWGGVKGRLRPGGKWITTKVGTREKKQKGKGGQL